MKKFLKHTHTIAYLLILIFIIPVFAFAQSSEQQLPTASPVGQQPLQPIQRTFNSQSFGPDMSAAASSMAVCVGSSALVNLIRGEITKLIAPVFDPLRVPTSNIAIEGKETGAFITGGISWDQLGWCLVNSMIESISAATVNWINSGFQGNPVFVNDPIGFFNNLADYQASMFLYELGGGFMCPPIQDVVRMNIAQSYNQAIQPFPQRAQCTFTGNLDQFMSGQSFTWDDWFQYTQNPYNNPLGATMFSTMEMDRRISQSVGLESQMLDWGGGFFSARDPETGFITSPGSVIENQVNQRLFSGQRRLEIADEFDEVVHALVNQLIRIAVDEMLRI